MSSGSTGEAILGVQSVSKAFGAQPIFSGLSITVHSGDRIGLIGDNGAGKSTLLRIMARDLPPDEGEVTWRQGLRVALLEQQPRLDPSSTVGGALESARHWVRSQLGAYERMSLKLAAARHGTRAYRQVEAAMAELHRELESAGAWDLEQDMKKASVGLRLPALDRVLGELSGGELRRVDLARAVLQRPDVLLLDEPTNQIDVQSIQWIETYLAELTGTCVLVTHDRYFLERIANRIVELEFGALVSVPGNYEEFLEHKVRRVDYRARVEKNRQAKIRRELVWLRRGAKARTTKQKARIDRFSALEEQGPLPSVQDASFEIPQPHRAGKLILEAEGIARSKGGRTLFQDFSLILQKDMRIGIIGPNGCGKTTLLRVLMGIEPPDAGRVRAGDATEFLYVDQMHEGIDPDSTILQHVSNGAMEVNIRGRRVFIPAYLEGFLFDRETVKMPMRHLSGGERNRLDIAKKLLQGGNVLVLDEPTNDLDLATLRVLEEAVSGFEGCALVVSHDRYFLNRLCTHIAAFEQGGHVVQIAGNYDDYVLYQERQRKDARQEESVEIDAPAPQKRSRKDEEKPRKLTWQEKQELDRIEDAILDAEAEVKRLEVSIHEPDFYARAYEEVQRTLDRLEDARRFVDQLYVRWQELEALAGGRDTRA